MKVKVTPKQKAQIRLLSDGELYRDAVGFVHKSSIVDNEQMVSLLNRSGSWEELSEFVIDQKGGDWQGARSHYSEFYTKLEERLDKLRHKVENEQNEQNEPSFVPNELTEEQSKQYTDHFAGLLAREFIQHLVDKMMSKEQEVPIRLLSDGELYRDAVRFVHESPIVENKQMAGLLEYSRSWEELLKFVRHQKGRDWQRKKAHYADFYTELEQYLTQLRAKVKNEYGMVPHNLTKRETAKYTQYFAGLLATEFIQHLVAEMMWKEKGLS